MRVLFTSLPAMGHLNSLMPLALATRDAGHEVAVCTTGGLASEVTSRGLAHLPGGGDSIESFFTPDSPRTWPDRAAWVRQQVFAKAAPNRLMPELREHVAAWRPDLIVRESAEFAGCVAAELAGLPHASVATGSLSARSDDITRFGQSLPELRSRHGLPPDPEQAMARRYLVFSLVPPSWDGAENGFPTLHHVRYVAPPANGALALPDTDRPLVLVALGTLFHGTAGLFETIIEALAPLPVHVLAAVGRDADPDRFGQVPANVTVVPWVPQTEVLRRAALFVSHGGFNSTKEALSHGVPLVVVPLGADQFYTAERVEALGLGLRVAPDERTAAIIRERATIVLHPAFRERAAAFAAEMATLPPLSDAVRLLERLVAERRPIRRAELD